MKNDEKLAEISFLPSTANGKSACFASRDGP